MTEAAVAIAARVPRSYRLVARDRSGLERFAVGVTAVAVAFLPLAVPTGPANAAPEDVLIAAAIAATLFWASTVGHRWRLPYVAAAGLFLVGGAVGGLAGALPATGAVALVQDLVLFAWCWAFVNVSRTAENLKILLATWVYSSIGWIILLYIGLATNNNLLTGRVERQGARVQLTLADPSYAANYFFISLMIMWATARPRNRAVRYVACGSLVVGIVLTGSNSGMVSLLSGVVAAATIGAYRRRGAIVAVAVLAALVLAGYAAATRISIEGIQESAHSSKYSFVRNGIGRGTSIEQRGMLLQESVRLYRAGNPLGEGPVSTKPRLQREMAPFVKEAHDDYLAALIERGALGFVGLLLFVASLGIRTLAVGTMRPNAKALGVLVRPNAIVGAVAGTMLASLVYELYHVRHVWALFAIVASVYIWGRE